MKQKIPTSALPNFYDKILFFILLDIEFIKSANRKIFYFLVKISCQNHAKK